MLSWKNNRKVLLGITGGISAYKTPDILRELIKNGCDVEVVLTEDAENFVSPMVLSTLLSKKVWRQKDFLSSDEGWKIPHIHLADWAEIILIAPATAESISRAARGEASSLLGAVLLAARCPVLFFPAMNVNMWEHKATGSNLAAITEMGYQIVEPASGDLACGYSAKGRLPDKEVIIHEIWRTLCPVQDLSGKNVLVTAGPTWEFLDPVRFLSNPSSGKMGFALARTAWYRGANVTVVRGPVELSDIHDLVIIPVTSAKEMLDAVISVLPGADYIVKAAAVGDYRPASISEHKIKRHEKDTVLLELIQNPDIAFEVGRRKRHDQILVGFAAESQNLLRNATMKMQKKNLDFIVVNDITASDAGFRTDTNTVKIINSLGTSRDISGSKEYVASTIWDSVMGQEEI